MAWLMSGKYLASCACLPVGCPCPADGKPSAPDGVCKGVAVLHIAEGNADGVDLSGVNWALWNKWASNPGAGNWSVGITIDSAASDEQAQALERIVSGREGGTFADLGALIGEMLGIQREPISVSDAGVKVGDHTEFSFDAARGADGNETTVSNAVLGFAPVFTIGRTSGRANSFGLEFEPGYGESAEFTYSSEGHEHIRA